MRWIPELLLVSALAGVAAWAGNAPRQPAARAAYWCQPLNRAQAVVGLASTAWPPRAFVVAPYPQENAPAWAWACQEWLERTLLGTPP
jgi:hypothetical protein